MLEVLALMLTDMVWNLWVLLIEEIVWSDYFHVRFLFKKSVQKEIQKLWMNLKKYTFL
jgi:hypothetical protein